MPQLHTLHTEEKGRLAFTQSTTVAYKEFQQAKVTLLRLYTSGNLAKFLSSFKVVGLTLTNQLRGHQVRD